MPRGTPLAPCRRCGGDKEIGPKGRKLCDACRALYEAERPEVARQRASDWYAANRERARAYDHDRRQDPEVQVRKAAVARAWVTAHPERAAEHRYRKVTAYRARKAEAFVEHVDPLVVLERADGACGICGGDVDPFSFEVDHIVPLSRGGGHSYLNVQPAHPRCNKTKGARMPEEVLAYA